MKAFFLAVFIIACAKAVTEVPSSLLGTWNYTSTTCCANADKAFCCLQSVRFATASNTSLLATFTGMNSDSCSGGSGEYEASDVEVEDSNSIVNFDLTLEGSGIPVMEFDFTLSNGDTLTLYSPNADCAITFTKRADLMKATFVAVTAVIAVAMIV